MKVENCFENVESFSIRLSLCTLLLRRLSLYLCLSPMASALSCRVALLCSLKTSFSIPKRRDGVKLLQIQCRSLSAGTPAAAAGSFTWDDALRVSLPENSPDDSSDLSGFFERIKLCNRGFGLQSEFVPFVVGAEIVGYIHDGFVKHLRDFRDVFIFPQDGSYGGRFGYHVTLSPALESPEDKTNAVAHVVECLGEALIPGIRNELYPVKASFGSTSVFSLERAAAPYFGIKAYGVHMNGYMERDGEELLWVAKRSPEKSTYPGMLDHLVAGGLPHDIACEENVVKECEEEAGIPRTISSRAISVGAVSYMDINGHRFKRDVLFCYDLKLPEGFVPENQDGEVESFKLIPVPQVANIIRRTDFFKRNCSLVIIDFLLRHGYIKPEYEGYLYLLRRLRSGDCS